MGHNQNLLKAIEGAKMGNYEQAARYLAMVVQSDPLFVDGWILLGHCLPDIEKRKYCYQRALMIDPKNEAAKISLDGLAIPLAINQPVMGISLDKKGDTPAVQEQLPKEVAKKRSGLRGGFIFGLVIFLVLCALPSAILAMGGRFDRFFNKYIAVDVSATPVWTTPLAALSPPKNQGDIDVYMANAQELIDNKNCKGAIDYLDKVVDFSDENYTAYYMRAKCYYSLNNGENSLELYNSNLRNALADVDKAIALQPAEAEYYGFRRDTLADLSSNFPYQFDRAYLLNLAVQNGEKYISLSTSVDQKILVSVFMANDLIYSGQCEAGMQLVEDLEGKVLPGDEGTYGCFLCVKAAGYACQGDMDKAVESLNERGPKASSAYFMSLYLYQAGRKDEALSILNDSIGQNPSFGGARYYVRSLIHLDMGDRDQAVKDLALGGNYSWEREELYAYIHGKLALEDGDKEQAIYWFQIAEASFPPYASSLQKQAQLELEQLNAPLLQRSLTIDYPSTPMPVLAP